MAVQIQYRHDTAANWTSVNPTLAAGEPGYETDTGKFKVGDGSTAWAALAYSSGTPGADGADGADGVGVPAGGTTGQALKKASNTDYDTTWDDIELVNDTTPQLGGDLDVNEKRIQLSPSPSSDVTANGIIISATVDTNAEGIGAPLFMAADGHFDTADADADSTAPCVALALETGTGSKKVLLYGVIRNDAWNWTIGPGKSGLIYLSTTVGTLTQTQPSGTDDVIQIVGWAMSADVMFFNPQLNYATHT